MRCGAIRHRLSARRQLCASARRCEAPPLAVSALDVTGGCIQEIVTLRDTVYPGQRRARTPNTIVAIPIKKPAGRSSVQLRTVSMVPSMPTFR